MFNFFYHNPTIQWLFGFLVLFNRKHEQPRLYPSFLNQLHFFPSGLINLLLSQIGPLTESTLYNGHFLQISNLSFDNDSFNISQLV